MPAWAPVERVSHILQLGLCHWRAPGPTNLMKRNAYLTQRNAFARHLSSLCVCMMPRGHPLHLYSARLWDFYLPIGHNADFLTGRSTLQAVPRLLDRVQSRTGLKDSHRYPTLTRCHCRDPMITISAPHETFMACWQWRPGKHPNFQDRACHILLFQGLVTGAELVMKLSLLVKIKTLPLWVSPAHLTHHQSSVQAGNSHA